MSGTLERSSCCQPSCSPHLPVRYRLEHALPWLSYLGRVLLCESDASREWKECRLAAACLRGQSGKALPLAVARRGISLARPGSHVATGFLLYHELERVGRPLADSDPGYVRYVLEERRFIAHLAWMTAAGLRGVSVREARAASLAAPGQVVITFDDGCETDWLLAAPSLKERGFGATFFVVSRWIGRRAGYLKRAQLRALAAEGFEVGSHSATHAYLSELDGSSLRREIVDSKREIEDIVGRQVVHLSCPGGRWNRRVSRVAREAGYDGVATSRIGANGHAADPFALARCSLLRDTSAETFEAFCLGKGLAGLQLRDRTLTVAKLLLGNRVYATLRDVALRHTLG